MGKSELFSTSDLQTCCSNDSILTISDDRIDINIKRFFGCQLTPNEQCRPIPFIEPLIRKHGNVVTPWHKYAEPFADIDELILTEESYFMCANSGMTKVRISNPGQRNVRVGDAHKIIENEFLFPFKTIPFNNPLGYKDFRYEDYDHTEGDGTNVTTFGASRRGSRLHAGVDLYYDIGEPIYSMADGVVVETGGFYLGTDFIAIEHDVEVVPGHKVVMRYSEIAPGYTLTVGDRVSAGDYIADVGLLQDSNGNPAVIQPGGATDANGNWLPGDPRGMLHLEVYTGEGSYDSNGNFISLYTNSGSKYHRRNDLYDDPEVIVDDAFETLCVEKERWDLIDRLKRINGISRGKLVAVDGAAISCPQSIL